MSLFLDIGILFILFVFIYQDFKFRGIDWYWFLALFVSIGVKMLLSETRTSFLYESIINISFLVLQFLLLKLYFLFKKEGRIVDVKIGKGDLLFYPIIALMFSPANFFGFYLLSLILILFIQLFRYKKESIPLAGYTSLFLVAFLIVNETISYDLFHGRIVESLFH